MKTTFPECPNERRFPRITSEEELAECGFRFSGQASSTQSTPKEHHHEIEPLINSNKEITVNSEMGFSSWRRSKSLAVRHWNFIDLIRKEVRGFSLKLYRFFNIYTFDVEENGDDDDYDEYLQQPEKKRRLFIKEVQCLKNSFETDNMLQNSFETDNKLEADRKIQLAKEIGLQLRQVTIWFQNRRARGKTKQMEKDFDKWQAKFNHIKCNHGSLLRKKEKAQS